MIARGAGQLPGSVQRIIKQLTETKVDFTQLLAQFVQKTCQDDYCMARPNRRYISQGIYLPSLRSDQLPEIVILIDDSGSMDERQLALAMAATDGAIAQVRPQRVHVYCCDSHVHWQCVLEQGEPVRWDITGGGGGTAFQPAFDAMMADGVQPACVLYFTDGDGYDRGSVTDPGVPVLWMLTDGPVAMPFGETVLIPKS